MHAKLIVFAVCLFVPALPARAQDELWREIVSTHNVYRLQARVPPMAWDDALAREAAGWAMHLGRTMQLQHSPWSIRREEGENLYMGSSGSLSAGEMVDQWGAERRDYSGGVFPHVSRTGQFQSVAHYTQMVWRDTRRVGCGMARAQGWDILVCRYSSPGNVIGQPVY